jgi:hypothetical protein
VVILLSLALIQSEAQSVLPAETWVVVLLRNNLILFAPTANPDRGVIFQVSGVTGEIKGIDVRPADGQLYAVTDAGRFYRIETDTGVATQLSVQDQTFSGGVDYGFDFNPTVDRIRVMGINGRNARYNIDTGALADFDNVTAGTQADGQLHYSTLGSGTPQVIGAAYTNSRPGATSTQLFDIDINNYNLVAQNPPNDGTLTIVGSLGVRGFNRAGFDIYTDVDGTNYAVLATNKGYYYTVDLTTGAATRIWASSRLLKIMRPRGVAIMFLDFPGEV